MDNTNEDFNVAEETQEEEETTEETTEEAQEEESVVISKEKFKAMQKKAMEFDALKKNPPKQNINNPTQSEDVLLEKVELLKVMDMEDLKQLESLAKGLNTSLPQAKESPLFTAYLEKKEAERKAEKAKLGASKGSSYKTEKPDIAKPRLSDEEHKELWKKLKSQ